MPRLYYSSQTGSNAQNYAVYSINLHDLSMAEMAKRELEMLKGGDTLPEVAVTPCPCAYEGTQSDPTDSYYGGFSTSSNRGANNS
jgi:natural product precursor